MTGYVYAVECGGRIKIGFSEDPQRRFNKIASDAPFPCELLGYWPGSVSDELAFHEQFKAVRVHGEWFAVTESLLAAVSDHVIPVENSTARYAIHEGDSVLAVWRKTQRIRGEEIAGKLGITRCTWSRWETGSHKVQPERCPQIELITGIPREQIRPDIYLGVSQ